MKHHNPLSSVEISKLVSDFEILSQKGTVSFIEETVFSQMIDYCIQHQNRHLEGCLLDEAIRQHPFSVELWLKKAHLQFNLNMIEDSLVTLEQAESLSPNNVEVALLRVDILVSQGFWDNAMALVQDLKRKDGLSASDKSDLALAEAQLWENKRQYVNMFRTLKHCLWQNPLNTEGYEKMLWAVEYSQLFHESIEFHNNLLNRDAYNWRAWLNLGFAYEALELDNDAVDAFEYAFAIEEKCYPAYMEAGELLLKQNAFERAKLVYENAIFNTAEDAVVLQKLGFCHENLDDLKTAQLYYVRSLELDGLDAETHFRMGCCAIKAQQYSFAIRALERAIQIDDTHEAYYAALGEAYTQTEQFAKALQSYRTAARIAPDDVTYWLRYARFLMSVGQIKMALKVLQEAECYAYSSELDYCRVACLYRMGKCSEALYRLSEALAKDYDKHTSLFSVSPELAENADLQAVIDSFGS